MLFVPKKDLIRLDMNIEEGMKLVISGGIITPPIRKKIKLTRRNKVYCFIFFKKIQQIYEFFPLSEAKLGSLFKMSVASNVAIFKRS